MPILITTRRRTLGPGRYDWAAWIAGDSSKFNVAKTERRAVEGLSQYFAGVPPDQFKTVDGKLEQKRKRKYMKKEQEK